MIYSKSHKLHGVIPMNITDWAPIHLLKPNYSTYTSELPFEVMPLCEKLKAIGIDTSVMSIELTLDNIDYSSELRELQEDVEFIEEHGTEVFFRRGAE